MEFVALFAILALSLVIAWAIMRSTDVPSESSLIPPHSETLVLQLARQLTGCAEADRPIINRILALGHPGIPSLFSEMIQLRQDDEVKHADKIAVMEGLLADFGVGAIPMICQQLSRSKHSSLAGLHALRIVTRLGPSGALTAIHFFLKNQLFTPELHRYCKLVTPSQFAKVLSRLDDHLFDNALAMGVPRLYEDHSIIDDLWQTSSSIRRASIIRCLRHWPTISRPNLVESALQDHSPTVRVEAIALATLTMHSNFIPHLMKLARQGQPDGVRALEALNGHDIEIDEALWTSAIASPRLDVAAMTLAAFILSSSSTTTPSALRDVVVHPELHPFVDAILGETNAVDWRALMHVRDTERASLTRLRAAVLAHHGKTAATARERLIRLAEAGDMAARTYAISALAQIGDPVAPDLLVTALRDVQTEDCLIFQQAAQSIGQHLAPILARRLHSMTMASAARTLTVMMALPYSSALPSLLHALEDSRDLKLDALISSTLFVGDQDLQHLIRSLLKAPEKGLLLPALSYMHRFAQVEDLPLLIEIYDDHVALRPIVLNMIEQFEHAAIAALRNRIEQGGDDNTLLPLEHRMTLLKACLDGTSGRI
ncbi:MAG: hypothetical protein VX589_03775 [Myxococcota bacterium]|nr:hypothetical protein [Myxococcota bacterium]